MCLLHWQTDSVPLSYQRSLPLIFSFENYSLCFIWSYPVAVLPCYFVEAEGKCTYEIPQALHSLIHDY